MRTIWAFINPQRTAGRIPLGRVTIATYALAALIFAGYTLHQKQIRFPLVSAKPYVVHVVFPDAKGLDPHDSPAAAVAGTPSGQVTKVVVSHGQADVEIKLDRKLRGKLFADATAQLRPASALQNLLVNIAPGTPEAGPLDDDRPIGAQRTTVYPAIDDATGILDADTQAYASILLHQASTALHGREGDLRDAVTKLAGLTDPATRLSRALARRRALLSRLVGELDTITTTTGRRGRQLSTTIDAAARTLHVTQSRSAELASVTRNLAPLLTGAQAALDAARSLARPLIPALDTLAPSGPLLASSLLKTRRLLPRLDTLVDRVVGLQRLGARPTRQLLDATRGIRSQVSGLGSTADQLVTLSALLDQYKQGAAQLATTLSGNFSVQDAAGPYSQVDLLKLESPRPENFGFPAGATAAQRRSLNTLLAASLERVCGSGALAACVARFRLPALAATPVTQKAHR